MLTVVLSNYNHARFLPEALEALLQQSRPADEIIVIDDASTDDSIEIVTRFQSRHPAIRLLRNAANLGVVENMNHGLQVAQGASVLFAAADDVTYPRLFQTGVSLLEEYPEAALFSARSDILDEDGVFKQTFPTPIPLPAPGFINPVQALENLLRDDSWFMGNVTLYRRSALLAVGGFPPELMAFADGYVARLLALKWGVCYSPDVLGAWRRMEGGMAWSQSSSIEATQRLIDLAERRMAETEGIFPPRYISRWKRRHLFGARRFMMVQARRKASNKGMLSAVWILPWEMILTAWLFLKLRPWDIQTVLRRRCRWWLFTQWVKGG